MTELEDRMTRLADAAVADRQLVDPSKADPSVTVPVGSPDRRRSWPWLGAAAAVLVLLAAAGLVIGARGGDGPSVDAGPGSTSSTEAPVTVPPVLAVPFVDTASRGVEPLGLTVTVRDADGGVLAERTTAELERPVGDGSGEVFVDGAVLVDLPEPGSYTFLVTGAAGSITCETGAMVAGDRLIVPVLTEDGPPRCGDPEAVGDWAHDSSGLGQRYLGLAEGEALERIEADGYRGRVTGRDGLDLAITMDAARDRFDLMVFDGVVVAASGVGQTIHREPRVAEPLGVVFVSPDGRMTGRGEVLVVVGEEGVQRPWGPAAEDEGGASVLMDELPAGAATLELQGQMCTMELAVAAAGTVVTIEVAADGTVDDRECPATVETLDEHVAGVTDGWDRYGSADAFVGLTEAEARARAEEDGLDVRVVDRDGLSLGRDDDRRTDRVNLVLYDDEVRAAAVF